VTVIAAAITETQGVVIAADSQWSNNGQRFFPPVSKLWTAENLAMGGSGCGRTGQVLKHHVSWPKYRPEEHADWERFLVKTVVPAIRAGTKDHGIVKTDSGVESLEIGLVLAAGDNLSIVYGNGLAISESAGRVAIGSGCAEALGALGDEGPWTEADVVDAVRRASATARGVGGAITVVDTTTLVVRQVEP
jgi:hypothetical protein